MEEGATSLASVYLLFSSFFIQKNWISLRVKFKIRFKSSTMMVDVRHLSTSIGSESCLTGDNALPYI